MYRTDLMEKAGLKMPEKPTWDFIKQAADKMTDKAAGVYGICLRGKPGWGENMAFLTAMSNSFGARWFDEKWQPQFNTPEWKKTMDFYVALMKADGPPGASSNGFNENLALFNDGKCGMWIDATVAAGFVTDPKQSKVADKVGFALAPNDGLGKNANWLWSWALAVPAGSNKVDAAEKFVSWATSKHYTDLVACKGRLGACSARNPHLALQKPGLSEGGALGRAHAQVDRLGGSRPSDREAGPLRRRAVRGDSPSSRASQRTSARTFRRRSPARRASTTRSPRRRPARKPR